MARTGLIQDERFQRHLTGPHHPENPERLPAIADRLAETGLDNACVALAFQPVPMDLVRRVHDQPYLDRLERACREGKPYIDVMDSIICPESFDIARLAAGAAVEAVDQVMAGKLDNAFCAIRPPGHHAERHLSLGFCLFNNVAVAARRLIDDHGLSRIMILDWDVHHGNGTQHIFEEDPRVLFISIHGHPGLVYPGTGFANERGRGEGEGFTLNVPVMPPSSNEEWQTLFGDAILPAIDRFEPQFVLISAGFDAHRLDPLAPLELDTPIFGWMTDQLAAVARRHAQGRLVSLLEGGYHLGALADSVALHVEHLLKV